MAKDPIKHTSLFTISRLCLILIAAFILTTRQGFPVAYAKKKPPPSLTHSSITLYIGTKQTLNVRNISKKTKMTWKSGNKKIVAVSRRGVLSAKKAGKTKVTVRVRGKTLTCKVTVAAPPSLNRTSSTLKPGKTLQLKVNHLSKKNIVKWSSSNHNVAVVSKSGQVRANQIGTATITAKADGKTLKCKLTVTENHAAQRHQYRMTVARSSYIMHALGGINGKSYTNSLDALDKAYSSGARLFEADVSFTSDQQLVLAHSAADNIWTEKDWVQRLGQPYDPLHTLPTYEEFCSFVIQGQYHATTLAELMNYMAVHPDMYVMVDAGKLNYGDTLAFYTALAATANGNTELLDRLIAGGQTTDMLQAAREVYDFPLLNLYLDNPSRREKKLKTAKQFISYCERNDIISFSTAAGTYTDSVAKAMKKGGLISYVFTVNEAKTARRLLDRGADIIGTDFLRS